MFHCRFCTLKWVSKSSHSSLRCIFWSATWNKNITNTFTFTCCSQEECLPTWNQRWTTLSDRKIQWGANTRKHIVYTDTAPIWFTLHSDLLQSCWHGEAMLRIIPPQVKRRKSKDEERVGRQSRNLKECRAQSGWMKKYTCTCTVRDSVSLNLVLVWVAF